MNGLLSSASPWQNDSNLNSTAKKRTPSMSIPRNKTIKNNNNNNNSKLMNDDFVGGENEDNVPIKESFHSEQNTIESVQQNNQHRLERVQQLIHNMNVEDDGQSLANFKPIDYSTTASAASASASTPSTTSTTASPVKPLYSMSNNTDMKSNSYSSYNDVYLGDSKIGNIPYYKNNTNNMNSNANQTEHIRIMEKLNRMMHILEEQQYEPTKHITEEFILYTFLGVFVIYVIDSFTRAGKYIR